MPLNELDAIGVTRTPEDDSLSDLRKASMLGDLERVTELVDGHSRPLDYLDHGLRAAAEAGQVAVARYILDQGAIIGTIPVLAARANSIHILELLMEYGWKVNDANAYAHFALS